MLGYQFFLIIVDDFIRYTWVFPMHNKFEVKTSVVNFIAYAKNHFSIKVKTICTDNGIKFSMHDFFASKGIIIKPLVLKHLSKMVLLKENINTS